MKNIYLLGGVHGNEPTAVLCLDLFKGYYSDKELNDYTFVNKNEMAFISNRIYKQPVTVFYRNWINSLGLRTNSREFVEHLPPGNLDLNRAFETETTKLSFSQVVSSITEKIRPSSTKFTLREVKMDLVIDIHSSPDCTEFVLINQNEYANSYVEFCKKFDIPYAIRYSQANTIKRFCLKNDVKAFTLELNRLYTIDEESAMKGLSIIRKIIENMDHLVLEKSTPVYPTLFEIDSEYSGLFVKTVQTGEIIDNGDAIGYILTPDGDSYDVVHRGNTCRIIYYPMNSYYTTGSGLAGLQEL